MKRISGIFIGVALVSTSSPQSSNDWIQVDGGEWNPDARVMESIQREIHSYVEGQAKSQGLILQPWAEYSFQYQGIVTRGSRRVYINAFCDAMGAHDLKSEFLEVFDGGTCYFSVLYSPGNHQFSELSINGEA
jgi:hypothetical protein